MAAFWLGHRPGKSSDVVGGYLPPVVAVGAVSGDYPEAVVGGNLPPVVAVGAVGGDYPPDRMGTVELRHDTAWEGSDSVELRCWCSHHMDRRPKS